MWYVLPLPALGASWDSYSVPYTAVQVFRTVNQAILVAPDKHWDHVQPCRFFDVFRTSNLGAWRSGRLHRQVIMSKTL